MVTGKRGLSEEYEVQKKKQKTTAKSKSTKPTKATKQSYTMKPSKTKQKGKLSPFWIFILVTLVLSFAMLIFMQFC